ncbi:MAG TPA: hypothetical protein VMM18_14930 [Gemmatimonadaceae bacterium]|nr:hypothetical protein [Gemmatimonadaceae bacterium]
MSSPSALLVLIGALYLIECVAVVPGGYVAFRPTTRGSWAVVSGGMRLGEQGRRLVLAAVAPWRAGLLLVPAVPPGAADEPGARLAFDRETIGALMARARAAIAPVRVDGVAAFVWIFGLAPLMVWTLGWSASWPTFLLSVPLFGLLVVGDARRAFRMINDGRSAPVSLLVTMALSPAAAMRAADPLMRAVLARHHALAVASVLCDQDAYERFAEECVRARRRVARSSIEEPAGEPPANAADHVLAAAEADLVARTIPGAARFTQPPARRDPSALAYCPACLLEYVVRDGACEDCGGVVLERYPA